VTIARKNVDNIEEKQDIIVKPHYWDGYGVLGCHFYSLQDKEGAFVKVKDVLPGSPAELSGLINKDHIVEFGTVTAETYVDLQKSIAPLLHASIGVPIPVLLKRVGKIHFYNTQ
jgi:S1-C subfamily serine protease